MLLFFYRSAHGVLLFGFGIMLMRAAALATAAPGLFAGTAPHKHHHGDQHNAQKKKRLPIHGANITAKTNRATVIFYSQTRL
jgi:hypothetical protein